MHREGKSRDAGMDALRLLCMLMLAAYHFINYYGSQYVSFADNGVKALIIQNVLWGGGRMICNVFFFISAWHLCEKEFRVERLFKMWISVLLYSAAVGVYSYGRYGDFLFLIRHLFPLETGQVWYVSAYMAVLIASPLLNVLLKEENRNQTKRITACLFVIQCVIPTFYPKAGIRFSTCGWFCLAYLIIGIIKKERIRLDKRFCLLMFLAGWFVCLGFYNGYNYLMQNERMMALFTELGFYRNVYFADLASLPCFFSALGLFLMFRGLKLPGGGILAFISAASVDVYIVSSIEGYAGGLAWMELSGLAVPDRIYKYYICICIGIVIGVVTGNIRERVYDAVMNTLKIRDFFSKMDEEINRKTVGDR